MQVVLDGNLLKDVHKTRPIHAVHKKRQLSDMYKLRMIWVVHDQCRLDNVSLHLPTSLASSAYALDYVFCCFPTPMSPSKYVQTTTHACMPWLITIVVGDVAFLMHTFQGRFPLPLTNIDVACKMHTCHVHCMHALVDAAYTWPTSLSQFHMPRLMRVPLRDLYSVAQILTQKSRHCFFQNFQNEHVQPYYARSMVETHIRSHK